MKKAIIKEYNSIEDSKLKSLSSNIVSIKTPGESIIPEESTLYSSDYSDEDDDDDDDDEDTYEENFSNDLRAIIEYDNCLGLSTNKKRKSSSSSGGLSIKEHSKKQRDKKKVLVKQLESIAKSLSEEHKVVQAKLETDFNKIKTNRDNYTIVLNNFLDLLFSKTNYSFHESENMWKSVASTEIFVNLPRPSFTYEYPFYVENECLNLHGISELIKLASRTKLMWSSLARLGNNVTDRIVISIHIEPSSHLVQNNKCNSNFTLKTKNSIICGASQELSLKGSISAEFDIENKLKSVYIFYNEFDLYRKICNLFGESVVNQALFKNINHARNSVVVVVNKNGSSNILSSYFVTTSSSPFIITEFDNAIKNQYCIIDRNNSIILTHKSDVDCLIQGHVLSLDSFMTTKGEENDNGDNNDNNNNHHQNHSNTIKSEIISGIQSEELESSFFIQAIPLTQEDSSSRMTPQPPKAISSILWSMKICRTSNRPIITVLISDLIKRILNIYKPILDSSNITNISESKSKCKNFHSMIKRASQELNLDDNAHVSVIAYVRAFMRWVSSLERRCRESEASIINKTSTSNSASASAPQKTVSFDKSSSLSGINSNVDLETSSGRLSPSTELSRSISVTSLNVSASSVLRGGGGASITSEGETSCELSSIDIMDEHYLRNLLQEVSNFFHQIRSSNIITKLVRFLKITTNLDEQKAIEQFIWYAWSKHSSVQIQDHMIASKSFIEEKKYEQAYIVLSKIIDIDPFYAEAYNKRSIVCFSLQKSQESLDDINTVIELEPLHYGALCGKALMLIKLKKFEEALALFDKVSEINPLLVKTSLSETIKMCRKAFKEETSL